MLRMPPSFPRRDSRMLCVSGNARIRGSLGGKRAQEHHVILDDRFGAPSYISEMAFEGNVWLRE